MVKRRGTVVRKRRTGMVRHQQRGGSLWGSISKGLRSMARFAKKHKVLSRGAKVYSMTGLPYGGYVSKAGRVAGKAGYGKKRKVGRPRKCGCKKKGGGLTRGGGGLKRSGGGLKRSGSGVRRKTGGYRKQTVYL